MESRRHSMASSTAVLPSAEQVPWWLVLLEGIAGLLIGILLVTQPQATLYTIVLFVGVYWFVGGIIQLVMLFVDHRQWGWKLLSGVIGILAGLVVIRHPAWSAVLLPETLVWLLGLGGVVIGALWLFRSFAGGGWGQGILAAISILLGLFLLGHTFVSTVVLLYAVAIWAIFGGIVAIVGSFLLRSRAGGVGAPAPRPAPQG